MVPGALKDFVGRWLDAFRRRDSDALAELYAPTAVLEGPMAGRLTGRAAITSFYQSLFSASPHLTLSDEQILIEGPRAAAFSVASGTHQGELFGYTGSGRHMQFRWGVLFTIGEAGIEHELRCYDFTGLLLQTGIFKAKPA